MMIHEGLEMKCCTFVEHLVGLVFWLFRLCYHLNNYLPDLPLCRKVNHTEFQRK